MKIQARAGFNVSNLKCVKENKNMMHGTVALELW